MKSIKLVIKGFGAVVGMMTLAAQGENVVASADAVSGQYSGNAYAISVVVSKPTGGYTVQLGESDAGPWHDQGTWGYVDACPTGKAMYYKVSATGYDDAIGSAMVTIAPKPLTEQLIGVDVPFEGIVYDGTAKTPSASYGDTLPAVLTENDFDTAYADNVNAGEATVTYTGKNNYSGTVTDHFDIEKADNAWTTAPSLANWTYGQTASEPVYQAKVDNDQVTVTYSSGTKPTLPGDYTATFTVPESQNYNELSTVVSFKVIPATISVSADAVSGQYSGNAYAISVVVSKPTGGYTVQLGESDAGPWHDQGTWGYVDACPTGKAMYYKVSATGYDDAIGSAMVTIAPKPLTEQLIGVDVPFEGIVYDGTAKTPSASYGDTLPAVLTENDFDTAYADNVNAGEATVTYTGKNNYSGTVTDHFDIEKAKGWDSTDEEPGSGVVPSGGKSKFDATAMYDGQWHTINTHSLKAVTKEGFALSFEYALAKEGPFSIEPILFKDVTVTSIWYKICLNNPNYEDYVHEAKVTITVRDITNAAIAPIADVEYTGVPVTPVPTVTDGTPSIITTSDYTVSYANNNAPGTATLTLTGKGNYTGTKSANFTITSPTPKYASFTGSIAWKLNLGSGCYTAQLKLTCTNGFESGISNLRYLFADRTNGSKTTASLWNSSLRAARPTVSWRDVTYRSVSLDASKITRQGASVIYGVKDISQSKGVISSDECTIELYVPSLAVPSSYEGLVVWTSGGSDHALKISASGGATPVSDPATAAAPALPILTTVTPIVLPTATTDELGLRNVFTSKDKTDKAIADAVLSTWKGTYVMAYPEIDEDGVTNGWNTFSIKIGIRGRTIVAGILANGKSVSASAQMLVGDEWCKIAVSSTRKNATFAFTLWPSRDGEVLEVEGVEGAVIDEVGNLAGESAFKMSADDLVIVLGTDAEIALGDVLPEDVPITLKGYRWILPTAGSVRVAQKQLDYSRIKENPSALRLSFSKTTGRFMGSFKVYLWNGTKLKYVAATVKGIVVGGVGYGTAKVGRYGTLPISVVPVEAE